MARVTIDSALSLAACPSLVQWMLVVASVNIEWPHALSAAYAALSWLFAASNTSTGLDCLLVQRKNIPMAVQKLLLSLLMPLALLLILIVLDVIITRARLSLRKRKQQSLPLTAQSANTPSQKTRWVQAGAVAQTAIVLVFFFLPSLLRTAYGLFACVQLDSVPAGLQQKQTFLLFNAVGSFWLLDINQQCFAGYHRGWAAGLGVPLLFLLCIVVPFGVIVYLWTHRNKLQNPYYLQHYGFLYTSYRPSKCYWEGVVALQVCGVLPAVAS